MKILGTRWFNKVGIVQVEDPSDGIKYYIKEIDGLNKEHEDARLIADWGSVFPRAAGDVLFRVTR